MQISELVEAEHLSEVSGCACHIMFGDLITEKKAILIAKAGEGGSHPREKREQANTTF